MTIRSAQTDPQDTDIIDLDDIAAPVFKLPFQDGLLFIHGLILDGTQQLLEP